MNARISRVKKDNKKELRVHVSHVGRPLCGGGRGGRSIESWQTVGIKGIDCLRCIGILLRRAEKGGLT